MELKRYNDGEFGGCNTYVLKNKDSAIIIDAGVSLTNFIDDIKGLKIEGVFITHAHFDHIYYLEGYLKELKADLYISDLGYQKLYDSKKNMSAWFVEEEKERKQKENIKNLSQDDFMKLLENEEVSTNNEDEKLEAIELIDKYDYIPLIDGQEINLDNFKIKCVATPGHSCDSFTFIILDSAFVGDLIFANGTGRTDFYDGNQDELMNSIKKLSKYSQIRKIHSGHGQSTRLKQK